MKAKKMEIKRPRFEMHSIDKRMDQVEKLFKPTRTLRPDKENVHQFHSRNYMLFSNFQQR